MTDAPFWSDDFDMDLPKVIPGAKELLGDLADVQLWAAGKPDRQFGNLNHPSVWNGENAMLAFFGFNDPAKPAMYYNGGNQVRCTAWEAFRDAWSHQYLIQVEQRPIWDTGPLWRDFETIMFDLRGWRPQPAAAEDARTRVTRDITKAVRRLRAVCAEHGRLPRPDGASDAP